MLRRFINMVLAKLNGAYPCRACGYRYTCGDPPGEDCHS